MKIRFVCRLGGMFLFALTVLILTSSGQTLPPSESQPATQDRRIPRAAIHNWLLEKKKGKNKYKYNEQTLIRLIEREGLSFTPIEDDLEAFKAEGASPKLLSVIQVANKPADQPAPPVSSPHPSPRPKQGQLTAACQPVDCEIALDKKPVGSTKQGVWSQMVPEGTVTVSATKQDYDADGSPHTLVIKDGQSEHVEFKLTPRRVALEAAGARLFMQMIEALGGDEGLKAAEFSKSVGAFKYSDAKIPSGDLIVLFKPPDKAKFLVAIEGGTRKWQIFHTDHGIECKWDGKGKEPKEAPELTTLDPLVRRAYDHYFTKTIRLLRGESFRVVADQLAPQQGQEAVLHATNGVEIYGITLDRNLRPGKIVLESGGLDTGLTLRYLDYTKQGSAYFPKRTDIISPDSSHLTIELLFNRVDLAPADVTDKDFELPARGGLFRTKSK